MNPMKTITNLFKLALFIATGIVPFAVNAHHSTTMFDRTQVVTITGVVKEVQWTNPHVAIFVSGAVKEGDEQSLWLMEMTSPGNLIRVGGWSRTAVKAGDKVVVEFFSAAKWWQRRCFKENYRDSNGQSVYSGHLCSRECKSRTI
ncbi:DUF6152 family protein [Polynucleobacter sphagniphilus]|uniref:DUF6152 family protein n=1 Tax=Polynucleobacter sphagniphilus TaxID=1743169 RepID=UPI00117C3492|nr:DUF6152 family protein [Polynucleobacter sphagniphilus]